MSRKRTLQEEVVLTGEESDAINQINKEFTTRNPKLIRNVSLTPFQLLFCDETKATNFIHQLSRIVIHVSTTNFDTTKEISNRFQLVTFVVGSPNSTTSIPLLFCLCGSSAEEMSSSCFLAIRRFKFWLGSPEKLSCVFGPPELKNAFQEQFSDSLPYYLSFTEVSNTDPRWMVQNFPEHSVNLQASLKLLFHNNQRTLEEFLQYWTTNCPSYAEDFTKTWNPSANPIEKSHFVIDSVVSTFLNQLHQTHGDPIANISFPSLISTLHTSLEHWYFYWETQQQIAASLEEKNAIASFRDPAEPELPPLTPSSPQPSLDDSFLSEPEPSPAKQTCKSCAQKRHARCSHGLCRGCCQKNRCAERTHMKPEKLRILLAKEIRDINDAIRLKMPLQITYQNDRNILVLYEVVWKKQAELFSGRHHTKTEVYKLMHVKNSKVLQTKPEK